MKKIGVSIIFLLVLPLVIASCTNDDQIIMRISSNANAHGAKWDQSYPIKICYNDLFGKEFEGEDPHDCSDNRVVSLSAITNAHASTTHNINYNIDICYGNLICESGPACSEDYRHILSLSSETNAHLELPGGDYNVYLCCKPNYICGNGICEEGEDYQNCVEDCAGQISSKWTDTLGNQILSSDIGIPVRLNISGENLENAKINYTIYKDSHFHISYLEADNPYQDWNAGEKRSGELESGIYQFLAVVNNDGREAMSSSLTVVGETTCDDLSCTHEDCTDEGCEGEFCEDSSSCICMDYEDVDCHSLTQFNFCGDYYTKLSCVKDKANIGNCEWLSGNCVEKIRRISGSNEFTCIKSYTKEDIGYNRHKISWTAVAEWLTEEPKNAEEILQQEDCVDGERIIRYNVLKLPFFTIQNLIIAAILIIIIYFLIKTNKKKPRRR